MTRRPRLLFVDDDSSLLDGLRRVFRAERGRWETAYASSGDEALSLLQIASFDVVVSDMRMPGMDGADLLTKVAERHPATIRFILSGQADQQCIDRSIAVTHRFLSKPCPFEDLRRALEDSLDLHERIVNDHVRQLVTGIQSLPSLPTVFVSLRDCVLAPDATFGDAASIIERDPAIATKVLQIVNSAFLGLPRKVCAIKTAISLIGLEIIKGLVLSHGLVREFVSQRKDLTTTLAKIAAHGMSVAFLARRVGTDLKLPPAEIDLAFTSSLLHGVGDLLLTTERPELMQSIRKRSMADGVPLGDGANQIIGCRTVELSAYLARLWGLPAEIVDSLMLFESPWMDGLTEFPPPPAAVLRPALATAQIADSLIHAVLATSGHARPMLRLKNLPLTADWDQKLTGWRTVAMSLAASNPGH